MTFENRIELIINLGYDYGKFLENTMVNDDRFRGKSDNENFNNCLIKFNLFNDECSKVILNELVPRLKKNKIDISDSPIKFDDIGLLVSSKLTEVIDHRELRKYMDDQFENYEILRDAYHPLEWYNKL